MQASSCGGQFVHFGTLLMQAVALKPLMVVENQRHRALSLTVAVVLDRAAPTLPLKCCVSCTTLSSTFVRQCTGAGGMLCWRKGNARMATHCEIRLTARLPILDVGMRFANQIEDQVAEVWAHVQPCLLGGCML